MGVTHVSSATAGAARWEEERTVRDFDEFYRSEFSRLVALAVAILGHGHGAEDLVQEAMLDAHRRWDRIGGYDSPRAWVRTAVVQRAIKVTKKRSNERNAALRALPLASTTEGGSIAMDPRLRAALLELPSQQRAAVALHYLEDASVHETAEILGVTDGTIKTHLSRGRARLVTILERDSQEHDDER